MFSLLQVSQIWVDTWYFWMACSIDRQRDYMPTAPKVPDTLQQPIENVFGIVKQHTRDLQRRRVGKISWKELHADFETAWGQKITPECVKGCFRHAMQAIEIWSALETEHVTVKRKRTTYELYGTHGGWVHKKFRG